MAWFLESESCQQTGKGVWVLSLCLMMTFMIWLGITAVFVIRKCLVWCTTPGGMEESKPLTNA
jgi:hypothetical protein